MRIFWARCFVRKRGGIKMAKEVATFAGGCFWCMIKPFDTQPGIESVIAGYTGGP